MSLRAPSAAAEGLLYGLILAAPLAFGCVEPWSQALLECACFGLALLCLFRPERRPSSPLPLIAVAVVVAIGAAQRLVPSGPLAPPPARPFTASLHGTKESMLLWTAYASLAWSVPRALRDWAAARRFAWAVVGSGVLVAAVGVAQDAVGARALYGLRYASADASPFGPYYNHDHAAALMAASLCLAAGFFASRLAEVNNSWRTASPDWLRAQAGTAAVICLLVLGLALCASRGATLGLLLGGGAVLVLAARFVSRTSRRMKIYAAAIGAWALGLCLTALALQWDVRATGMIESSLRMRLSLYGSGLRMLREAPLFGWGLGAFGSVFGAYQSSDVVGVAEHVHGDWLELALQCGLLGLGLFLLLFAAFAADVVSVWWAAEGREARALLGGGLAALLGFGIHCLVDFCSQIPADAAIIFALVGWLSCARTWSDQGRARRGSWPRWRWLLAPAWACLLVAGAKPAVGAWYARTAELAPPPSRRAPLLRAAAWDKRPEYLYRLGLNYFDLGMADPASRSERLRSGLPYARAALALQPLNPDYLYLMGAYTWRLGDPRQGRSYLAQAQRFRFDPIVPDRSPSQAAQLRAAFEVLRGLKMLPDEWVTR
jgi:O-antigen ligase